jgi:hypothetical protein
VTRRVFSHLGVCRSKVEEKERFKNKTSRKEEPGPWKAIGRQSTTKDDEKKEESGEGEAYWAWAVWIIESAGAKVKRGFLLQTRTELEKRRIIKERKMCKERRRLKEELRRAKDAAQR